MNKLLKSLDEKAVAYALSVCDANGVFNGKEYLDVVKEHFASLIIEECVSQCKEVSELHFGKATTDSAEDGQGPEPEAFGAYMATIKCRTKIKELFNTENEID